MKISQELPQFNEDTVVIGAMSGQDALMYVAHNGEITCEKKVHIDEPVYSDRESFFEHRHSTAGLLGSGSVYESKKDDVEKELLREVVTALGELRKHNKSIAHTYLFVPHHMQNTVKEKFPKVWEKEVTMLDGNFLRAHPFGLIQRIQDTYVKISSKPISKEAQKILKKSKVSPDN